MIRTLFVLVLLAGAVFAQSGGGGSGQVRSPNKNDTIMLNGCVHTDGKVYLPCESFPQSNIVSTKNMMVTPDPTPEWVPDPSAGHYDCKAGWTAYSKSEPVKYSDSMAPIAAVYNPPPTDAKGHVLGVRPPAPICIKDKP